MSQGKQNVINIEHMKSIIKRQTDYSDEEIILKMKIHNNDPMAIMTQWLYCANIWVEQLLLKKRIRINQ